MRPALTIAILLSGCLAAPPDLDGPGTTSGSLPADGHPWDEPRIVPIPVEDGGYEPGIEFSPEGTMVLHAHRAHAAAEGTMLASWLLYSLDNGTNWSPVPSAGGLRETTPNLEGDVAFDEAGHMFYVEVGDNGLSVSQWTLQSGKPVHDRTLPVTGAASHGDRPWVEGFGDGGLYMLAKTVFAPSVQRAGETAMVQFFQSLDAGLSWEMKHGFVDSDFCDIAVDPGDHQHVVVGCVHQSNVLASGPSKAWASVHASHDAGSTWTETRVMETEGATRRFPSIDMDRHGTIAFTFTLGDPQETAADLMLAIGNESGFAVQSLTDGSAAERPWVSIQDGSILATGSILRFQGTSGWHPWAWTSEGIQLSATLLDSTPQSAGEASPGDFWQNALDPFGGMHACWGRLVSQGPVVAGTDFRNTILCSHRPPP